MRRHRSPERSKEDAKPAAACAPAREHASLRERPSALTVGIVIAGAVASPLARTAMVAWPLQTCRLPLASVLKALSSAIAAMKKSAEEFPSLSSASTVEFADVSRAFERTSLMPPASKIRARPSANDGTAFRRSSSAKAEKTARGDFFHVLVCSFGPIAGPAVEARTENWMRAKAAVSLRLRRAFSRADFRFFKMDAAVDCCSGTKVDSSMLTRPSSSSMATALAAAEGNRRCKCSSLPISRKSLMTFSSFGRGRVKTIRMTSVPMAEGPTTTLPPDFSTLRRARWRALSPSGS